MVLLTCIMTSPVSAKESSAEKPDSAAESPETVDKGKRKRWFFFRKKKKTESNRRRARGNAPCLAWLPQEGKPRAVLLCVHGLGLHNGTYEPFGKKMSSYGYAVYAIDVRGFGSWMACEGRKKVDFSSCLEDVRTTLKVMRRAHRTLPVFLLGESMGGAIALRACAMYPDLVDGLISSVPASDRFKQHRTTFKVALHLFKSPDKPINVGEGVVKQATKDPELRKDWINDPLARMNLSPRELIQFDRFMKGNHKFARKIVDKPVLVVQGSKDKLVKPKGTMEVFNKLRTKDKKFVLIPQAEHLIFEENQFSENELRILDNWLKEHMDVVRETRGKKHEHKKRSGAKTSKSKD